MRVASCKLTSWESITLSANELWVYHNATCMLRSNKLTSCKPTSLCVASSQVNDSCGTVGLIRFKGALSGLRESLTTESPLKIMKNAFYFTLKLIFALKIFWFLSSLFGHIEKQLNYKHEVNFKFYDVTVWEKTIAVTILPNISRSKDKKIMKCGHLIEYNMRNIFLEKSYIKFGGETIPRPFSKRSKLSMSLDQ